MFLRSFFRSITRRSVLARTSAPAMFQPRPLRRLMGGLERLDDRLPLAADMEHFKFLMALDVSGDGAVTSLDALQIINQLNNVGAVPVRGSSAAAASMAAGRATLAPARFDTNGDLSLSPIDALGIINRINNHGTETIAVSNMLGDALQSLEPQQQSAIDSLFRSLNGMRVRSDILPDQITDAVARVVDLIGQVTLPTAEQLNVVKDAFFSSIADGELSASDLDALQDEVRQLILSLNVPQAEVDSLIADLSAMYSQIELNDADLDALLGSVESLVNSFSPNTLDLPSVSQIRQFVADNIDQLSTLLANAEVLANSGLTDISDLIDNADLSNIAQLLASAGLSDVSGLLTSVNLTSLVERLDNVGLPNLSGLLANAGLVNLAGLLAGLPIPNLTTPPTTPATTDPPPPVAPPPVEPPPVTPPPVTPPPVTPPPVTPPPVTPPTVDPVVLLTEALKSKLGPNPFGGAAGLQQVVTTLLQSYSATDVIAMLNSPAIAPYLPLIGGLDPVTALSLLSNYRNR